MSPRLKKINFGKIAAKILDNEKLNIGRNKYTSFDDISDIELNEDIDNLYSIFKETNSQSVLFLHGKAGTGKSYAVRYLRNKIKNTVVLASSAIAAINIHGQTIHSFFNIKPGHVNPDDIPDSVRPKVDNIGLLIIDEISMVNAAHLDIIDLCLKKANNKNKLFGGINVLLVGDLFQLPPVITTEEEKIFFRTRYKSEFFFSASALIDQDFQAMEMTKIRRQDVQTDMDFINALNGVRESVNIDESLKLINERYRNNKSINLQTKYTKLVPTKALAKNININSLANLKTNIKYFDAEEVGKKNTNPPAPDKLEIAVGAKIIFLKNNVSWVNGETGVVLSIESDSIRIKKDSSGLIVDVKRDTWNTHKYTNNFNTQQIEIEIIGSFTQFPISLGWAITIHKSQGMTLDNVYIDTGGNIFAYGQLYVALSRCRSLDGLLLGRKLTNKDVKVSPVIKNFYKLISA